MKYTSLGQALFHMRTTVADLTAAQLAKRADVTPSWISRVESGITLEPKQEPLIRVSVAMGVDPNILLSLAGHRTGPVSLDELPPRRLSEIFREAAIQIQKLEEESAEDDSPNNPARRELVNAVRSFTRELIAV